MIGQSNNYSKVSEDFSTSKLFAAYSANLMKDFNLLKNVLLPKPLAWDINLRQINSLPMTGNKRKWNNIPFFSELSKYSKNPATYYFMIDKNHAESIHSLYGRLASEKSVKRLNDGVKQSGYINFSHIPVEFKITECLYVGSVQDNIGSRIRQHLGYSSGRTGALYLSRAFHENIDEMPPIACCVHVLPNEWKRIRIHIECVMQDHLRPMFGKRGFRLEEENDETC